MPTVFQVVATRRRDLSDHCIAMRSAPERARALAAQYATALTADHVRVYVKPTPMTAADIAAVITGWGREDAASGEPRSGMEEWPGPWVNAYRLGFDAAAARNN